MIHCVPDTFIGSTMYLYLDINSPSPVTCNILNKRLKRHCGQFQLIELDSTGFPDPKNVVFDTNIKSLGQVEADLWKRLLYDGHFENSRWRLSEVDSTQLISASENKPYGLGFIRMNENVITVSPS